MISFTNLIKFFVISLLVKSGEAIYFLQKPGVGIDIRCSNKLDIDFISQNNLPLFSLKGEQYIMNAPTMPDMIFNPYKLVQELPITSLRINSATAGMIIQLYEGMDAEPKLRVNFKKTTSNPTDRVEVNLLDGVDHDTPIAEVRWVNRDTTKIKQLGGLNLYRLDVNRN